MSDKAEPFFAIVIGTGFAGAVTACRLVEAGFKICVLERGRRYGPEDFPRFPTEDLFDTGAERQDSFEPPPDFSRWLWSRDHGIYDIRDLDEALSIQAAGYGGGSLIYANVHLRPPRELFDRGWPEEYKVKKDNSWPLDSYFDLAAYMLRVSPIPKKLAKTLQLERAAKNVTHSDDNWFRAPLAVNFDDAPPANEFERAPHACDMRGRCCLGCDRQAKNTLDLNYLARAEHGSPAPDIRTLAEVAAIDRDEAGVFTVTYNDLLFHAPEGTSTGESGAQNCVRGLHVFLCAGSLSTTELLLKTLPRWDKKQWDAAGGTPLGSHYFPNADSVAGVFDCDEPHEADYGPTITSAFLFQTPVKGEFSRSLDFVEGRFANGQRAPPTVGARVRGLKSKATAESCHSPLLDWGNWEDGAAGTFVLADVSGTFEQGEPLEIFASEEDLASGKRQATAFARSPQVDHEHWFLAEDGGYPPNLEPLTGIFRSPLWLRRNRYIEFEKAPQAPQRRAPTKRLRVRSIGDSLARTTRRGGSPGGLLDRSFATGRFHATDLLASRINSFLPPWFVTAIDNDRKELVEQASAFALPFIGRLLGQMSKTIAQQGDVELLSRIFKTEVSNDKKEVLIRGMLRQGLQVLAGSEAAVATWVATMLLDPLPGTPEQLLVLLGDVLLWALAYGTNEGHTGIVLTMGRDLYRGRLELVDDGKTPGARLTARLPNRLLDTSSAMQERVLRAIASSGWHGELRANPAWTTLGKRVTVHNQGGCPMGPKDDPHSVTGPWGEVHNCRGLYVMDAAAFPTSVGVNPSATIAAVAELKVEHFIGERKKGWATNDKANVAAWFDTHGRKNLDPLNSAAFQKNDEPKDFKVLGLKFTETMNGFLQHVGDARTDFTKLGTFHTDIQKFTKAEDAGARDGDTIDVTLTATATDLARLISPARTAAPARLLLEGTVTLNDKSTSNDKATYALAKEGSFLEIFVRPSPELVPPTLFFRYKLKFGEGEQAAEIDGLKVLRNAPGFDLWSDTSTVYVEMSSVGHPFLRRGVMRVSIKDFLETQLPSMDVTNTNDQARRSWGLAAFYKYFIGELATVYVTRPEAIKDLFVKVLTGVHV